MTSEGVILIRYPGDARESLAQAVLQSIEENDTQLTGAFVVLQPGYIRISRSPLD